MNWAGTNNGTDECNQVVPAARHELVCDGRDFNVELELFEWDTEPESKTAPSKPPLQLRFECGSGDCWSWDDNTCDSCEGLAIVCYLLKNGDCAVDQLTFYCSKYGSPSVHSVSSAHAMRLLNDGAFALDGEYATRLQPIPVLFSMSLSKRFYQRNVRLSSTVRPRLHESQMNADGKTN